MSDMGQKQTKLFGDKACCIWLFGLSGSGKSTLAHALKNELNAEGIGASVLDGDEIRKGLNRDLGLTEVDRYENIRRAGEVAKLMVEAGLVTICSFITPYESCRKALRAQMEGIPLFMCYVKCSLEICEQRDVKGLYQKARSGLLYGMTGIDAVFDVPTDPDVVVETDKFFVSQCVSSLMDLLRREGVMNV